MTRDILVVYNVSTERKSLIIYIKEDIYETMYEMLSGYS